MQQPHNTNTGLFLIAVVSGATLVCIYIVLHPELGPGDKGTWLGALGTLAAFVGTIVLATGEARARRKKEHSSALLHGISMRLTLGVSVQALDHARDLTGEGLQFEEATFIECLSQIEQIPRWSVDDLVPLLDLQPSAAIDIAEAIQLLRLCERQINSYQHILHKPGVRIEVAKKLNANLGAASVRLEKARLALKLEVDKFVRPS